MCLIIIKLTTSDIIFLVCAVITLITAIINNWYIYFPGKAQEKHINAITQINRKLNNSIALTSSTRSMIFTTHNGKGLPNSHKDFKVTCLYSSNIRVDTAQEYINMRVDHFYAEILRNVIVNGTYKIKVSEMPDCKLKDIYILENIKKVIIYKIKFTKLGLVYISFASELEKKWSYYDIAYFKTLIEELDPLIYVTGGIYNRIVNQIKLIKSKKKR